MIGKKKKKWKEGGEKIKREKSRDKNKLAEMKKDGENKNVIDKIKCLLTDKSTVTLSRKKVVSYILILKDFVLTFLSFICEFLPYYH